MAQLITRAVTNKKKDNNIISTIGKAVKGFADKAISSRPPVSSKTKTAPKFDTAAETRKLREAQQASSINAIRERERKALAGLEGQRAEIAPAFQGARSATTASSELAGKRFRERTAGQGLSGAGVEADIRRTGALQRDIGGLRQQETKQYADIARTRSELGRAAGADIAQAKMGIQAQSIQDLINQESQRKQQAFQEASLTGSYGGQQTMAGRQAQEQSVLRGLQTQQVKTGLEQESIKNLVSQNYGDLQAAINNLTSQGIPPTDPRVTALQTARAQKVQDMSRREMEDELLGYKVGSAKIQAENEPEFQRLKLKMTEEGLESAEAETDYLNLRNEGFDDNQAADLAYKKAQISNQYSMVSSRNKADKLARDKFETAAKEVKEEIKKGGASETAILNSASKLVADSYGELSMGQAVQEVKNALSGKIAPSVKMTEEELDRLITGE